MALNFIRIESPPPSSFTELQEIRLLPNEPRAKPPSFRDWESRPEDQTIVNVRTGCRFKALRLEQPLIEGLRLPFASYEVGARFVEMDHDWEMPPPGEVWELGRQGIEWILTYTYESRWR